MDNRVIPVMGPGAANEDLERCPPSYHFELTEEELLQALRDPDATARRLGVPTGIRSIHISVPEGYKPTARAMYCCIKCLSDSWCCTAWPE